MVTSKKAAKLKRKLLTAKQLGILPKERKWLYKFALWGLTVKEVDKTVVAKAHGTKPHRVKQFYKVPNDGLFRFNMSSTLEKLYPTEMCPGVIRNDWNIPTVNLMPEGYVLADEECGAAGCIWGAAHLFAMSAEGESPFGVDRRPTDYSSALENLFFPNDRRYDYSAITLRMASEVTIIFLCTGKIKWPHSVTHVHLYAVRTKHAVA